MPSLPSQLERSLTLRGALTLNLLDIIGVGPFITLPVLIAAMGGPQAMLGWLLGAALAVCDGLVWAELGAAMPEAGGTYAYLRTIFPGGLGRWLSFLFLFQLCFSAPLSIASGAVGLAQYASYLKPSLGKPWIEHTLRLAGYGFGVSVGGATLLAVAVVALATALQWRRLDGVSKLARWLLAAVLLTIVWTIMTGMVFGRWSRVLPTAGAFHLSHTFFTGLGAAMLVATYDYWGYYNVTFLGGEARDPGHTIPRAVLGSIAIVGVLYLLLNVSVLSVLGSPRLIAIGTGTRSATLSQMMQAAYTGALGEAGALWMGRVAAVLVGVTAFGSVFSLLLGYARIPYAAARDGSFFRSFGRLHPAGFPAFSLVVLAGGAALLTPFSLGDLIAALVVVRIVLQFALQHIGLMVLRYRRPDISRPFRVWMYPLPPLLALLGFTFVALSRPQFGKQLWIAALVLLLGSGLFLLRELRRDRAQPPREDGVSC